MKLKKIVIMTTALMLVLYSGCSVSKDTNDSGISEAPSITPEPSDNDTALLSPADEKLFVLPIGGWDSGSSWQIDSNGKEVPLEESGGDSSYEINDLITGEPRYEIRLRSDIEYGANGYPQTVIWHSLWDLDGNMLIDWDKVSYGSAFGEYIVREYSDNYGFYYDDELPPEYHAELYHIPTGKLLFPGATDAQLFKNGNILLTGRGQAPMGIITAACDIVSGFPMQNQYYSARAWKDYIVASTNNPYKDSGKSSIKTEYLLDSDFNELFVCDWIWANNERARGDYFIFRDGDREGVYSVEAKGEVFSGNGASIEYYDGEVAITQTGSYRGVERINASLVTQNNEILAEGFLWLAPDGGYYEENSAERFIGLRDGKAEIIDRSGAVIASSQELPGAMSLNYLCEGLYTYYSEIDDSYGDGLLGANLEIIIPAGKYSSFEIVYGLVEYGETARAEDILLKAGKELGDARPGATIYRSDIIDHTGKVIIDNVTNVFDSSPNRLAIERGFSIGLMDWGGNWIVKRSIFSNSLMD